ncbi:MAG: GNAT family N-acetyltransferase [Burkholderiales bacterium]|nr:GNAT family N-acetyltransferase [Burkholderiales bacterium]
MASVELFEATALAPAQAGDAAALAFLAFEDFYSIFSRDRSRVLPAVVAQFATDSELNQLVAALDDGHVVGIGAYYSAAEMAARQAMGLRLLLEVAEDPGACVKGVRAFSTNFTPPGDAGAYVSRFAVAESQRGSGVAGLLHAHMESAITRRGWGRIRLHVRRDNARGLAFYRKLGYVPADPSDRGYLLLEKPLG